MTRRIVLVMDCDGTLAQDTTTLLVKQVLGDVGGFWDDVRKMVMEGWDPPLAWTTKLLGDANRRAIQIDESLLRATADKIQFFDGALDLEKRLRTFAQQQANGSGIEVELSIHVITSGYEDLLRLSALKGAVTEIWGSLLNFGSDAGIAIGPKAAVSFTEKTKFVFAINKGILKKELRQWPERVNDLVPRISRPVPFENMIYVGDGLTDIPCYSLIQQHGGAAVGIRNDVRSQGADEPLLWNYRPRWGPFRPDFREESDLTKLLKDLIHDVVVRSRNA